MGVRVVGLPADPLDPAGSAVAAPDGVVLHLADMTSVLVEAWRRVLATGHWVGLHDWLEEQVAAPEAGWRPDLTLGRYAEELGPDRVTLVLGSDPAVLAREVARLGGGPADVSPPREEVPAVLVDRLLADLATAGLGSGWGAEVVADGLGGLRATGALPGASPAVVAWVESVSATVERLGLRVVGERRLLRLPAAGEAPDEVPVADGVRLTAGLLGALEEQPEALQRRREQRDRAEAAVAELAGTPAPPGRRELVREARSRVTTLGRRLRRRR
jgi:hypothetical protein